MLFADEVTNSAGSGASGLSRYSAGNGCGGVGSVAEVEQGVGGRAVAHLVVESDEGDVVSGAVGEVLGDDEQRDALDAGPAAGGLGQHEVHDVLGQFVFARRDPHLGAGDPVGAVVGRDGFGGDVGQR